MDMLRFDQFTSGKTWVDEFGSPAQEADFRNFLNYSPYHNIGSGKAYPAILATTAEVGFWVWGVGCGELRRC